MMQKMILRFKIRFILVIPACSWKWKSGFSLFYITNVKLLIYEYWCLEEIYEMVIFLSDVLLWHEWKIRKATEFYVELIFIHIDFPKLYKNAKGTKGKWINQEKWKKKSHSKQMTNKTSTEWFTSFENYIYELQTKSKAIIL